MTDLEKFWIDDAIRKSKLLMALAHNGDVTEKKRIKMEQLSVDIFNRLEDLKNGRYNR